MGQPNPAGNPGGNPSTTAGGNKPAGEGGVILKGMGIETPFTVMPNLQGFGPALPKWQSDPKSKLSGVFRVEDDKRIMNSGHYSWMVNILPFLGHQDVYDKFDFTKPMHDDNNFKYGLILIPEFLNPSDPRQRWKGYPMDGIALTHFVGMSGVEDSRNVVAGKLPRSDPRAGVFGLDKIATPAEITDGLSQTIMVVGSGELVSPWIQGGGATIRGAREPYFDKITGFGSKGKSGPMVLMADGSIRQLSDKMDPAVFRAMCTIHGADTVDLSTTAPLATFDPPPPPK